MGNARIRYSCFFPNFSGRFLLQVEVALVSHRNDEPPSAASASVATCSSLLGCTLYKLLTGRPPFASENCRTPLDQILARRRQSVPPIQQLRNEVRAGLAAVVERMLAKNPAERFAAPAEVAEALKSRTTGSDLIGLWEAGPSERKRRKR